MAQPNLPGGAPTDSTQLYRLLFLAGSSFIILYASLLVIHTATLFLRVSLNDAATWLAVALTLVYYGVIGNRVYHLHPARLGLGLVGMIAMVAISALISGYFIDLSWDGRDYQQRAVQKLLGGWNPVYTTLQPDNIYKNAWLNHYPKGPWIAAASIVRLTGYIETGKLFNLLLLAAVFLVALAYFLPKKQLKTWQAGLLALFLTANPVSVYQSLSFYIDGQVSSTLILLILLMLLYLDWADSALLLTLAATVVIGVNIKFTGSAYVAMLLAIFVLAAWYVKRDIRALLPLWAAILSGLLVGVLLVGNNPYLVNTLRYGHPFYPLYGSDTLNKEFILRGQLPLDYETLSWPEKLLQSVFSPSHNPVGVVSMPIKFPLSVRISDVTAFVSADVRVSGWGPLFGALLIASLGGLALLALISWRTAAVATGLIGLVIGTMLLNSEAWWARYAPQLWLVPVVVLAALWLVKDRRARLGGHVLAALIFANVFIVSGAYVGWNALKTVQVRATLADLQQSDQEILIYYGPLEAAGMRLQEYDIPYHWVEFREELPCPIELEIKVFYSPYDCPPLP